MSSTHVLQWTEPTTALRDWLRAETTIIAQVGQRTYASGLPDGVELPALVVTRIGGGPSLPIDVGTFQFDCWATTGSGAVALLNALVEVLYSTPSGTTIGALKYGGAVDQPEILWLPDAEAGTPRYVVTVQIVTKTPNSP